MGMKIRDLFKLSLFSEAKLVAGEQGIDNEIVWFNLMEILDVIGSLEHGEFLITTGYQLDSEKINKNLISHLRNQGLSGLGIQLGYYIDHVPENILQDAEELNFPIIIIPEKITYSMITRTLYKELLRYQQEEKLQQKAISNYIISNLLENHTLQSKELDFLKENFFTNEDELVYILNINFSHIRDGIILSTDIENCLRRIRESFTLKNANIYTEGIGQNIAMLLKLPSEDTKREAFSKLEIALSEISPIYSNIIITIGAGHRISTIDDIRNCYNEAVSAQRQLLRISAKKGFLSVDNLEIPLLMEDSTIRGKLIGFAKTLAEKIIEYDRINSTEYYKTLCCFIKNMYNITLTSGELFIHRHTLKYRLNKIRGISGFDWDDADSRTKFELASFIWKLYL